MEGVNHRRLSYARHHVGLCKTLAAHIALTHCRQGAEENQIAIRFENGYGVTIVAVSQEEVFEVLVLRFYGAGMNDYQLAQYAPVPELNRGSWSEIIDLCQHIARLPINKARTGAPGQALQ